MLGAIAGDIIGSIYEHHNTTDWHFPLFGPGCRITDDSVLTIAVADAILNGRPFGETIKAYYRRYPQAGYGKRFRDWGDSDSLEPYYSYGNGSAMRVSPAGWAGKDLTEVLQLAEESAACTHNHPEGIRGAQAIAAVIYWARLGKPKSEIRERIIREFEYDLSATMVDLKGMCIFDVTCQGSVPQAISAFLESEDFESAIRNAIVIGGDSDTLACMAGAMAEAFYGGLPATIAEPVWRYLDAPLRQVVEAFRDKFVK